MKSIRCGFSARLMREAEIKTSKSGNPYVQFTIPVECGDKKPGEQYAPTEWMRVLHLAPKDAPDDYIASMAERLPKNAQVYVEGDLQVTPWLDRDGKPHCGLSLMAWVCQPMGQFRRPSHHDDTGRPAQGGQQNLSLPPDDPATDSGKVDGKFDDDDIPF